MRGRAFVMMVKKISLSAISSLFLLAANAQPGNTMTATGGSAVKTVITIPGDSLRIADSLKTNPVFKNDPKLGFKDLYTEPSLAGPAGQVRLNPLAISFVDDYMEKHGKTMNEIKQWGRPYFNMMDNILMQHGVPPQLKYLAVIESHLKPYAVSWVGAVGPWQFMPGTARDMGLQVNRYIDERTDYYKSTHAAARYLTDLFNLYGDWLLVVAAYNGGPGNVNSAIRQSGSRNFWKLQYHLPTESRNHVKKFIATHYIMEGNGSIATVTKDESKNMLFASATPTTGFANYNLSAEEMAGSKTFTLSGKYNSLIIAKHITMEIGSFNKYNPDFDNQLSAGKDVEMRLPADKMQLFHAKRYEILNESIQLLLNSVNEIKVPEMPTAPAKKAVKKRGF
jgi:membrane-bound lytic murein transglycosylase D